MINWIWGGLITIGLLSGVYQELFIPEKAGIMVKITEAAIGAAKTGVDLSLGLIGVMALFLGIMGIAEKAGLIQLLGTNYATSYGTTFSRGTDRSSSNGLHGDEYGSQRFGAW